jgi:hypothetical protein
VSAKLLLLNTLGNPSKKCEARQGGGVQSSVPRWGRAQRGAERIPNNSAPNPPGAVKLQVAITSTKDTKA